MTKFSPYHNTLPQVLFVKCLSKTNDRLLHTITWNCLDIPMNSKLVQFFFPVMLLQIFAVKHFENQTRKAVLFYSPCFGLRPGSLDRSLKTEGFSYCCGFFILNSFSTSSGYVCPITKELLGSFLQLLESVCVT